MSVKRQIWALPAASAVIFALGLAVSVYFSSTALTSIKTTEQVDYPVLDRTKTLGLDVQAVIDSFKDAVAEGDKKRIDTIDEQAGKIRDKLKKFADVPGQRETAERLAKEFDLYFQPARKAARVMLELEQGDMQSAVNDMQNGLKVLQADLAKSNDAAQMQFKNGIARSESSVRNVVITSVLVAMIVIFGLVVVSWFMIRAIWQQLGGEPEYAREIARTVADGDLSMVITTESDDRSSLLGALKDMQAKLAGMVSDIKISAETIKSASGEIASGNADLSSRTESQASSLEQTSSAMSGLTETVKQNADNARQANQLAASASDVATKGGKVVDEVVSTMGDITHAAKKIADIISVIDGIAFQTNILALNAAVEAARAGEQGRGFAVVAAEVRNLAQRSAAAAKEIKTLITDSVDKVNTGSKLVDQAGQTMSEIVESVKRVTDIMAEITAASQEQSSGIQEVSHAITQMDEMTQQNAALVEEAAAAAEAMEDQADRLAEALNVFKLAGAANALSYSAPRMLN
jgi:methyl-accepting chemotaxis protein